MDNYQNNLPSGLTQEEALKRLKHFGPNEIEKKHQFSSSKLLLEQFKSPLIYILIFAGLVSIFLKDWHNAIVIFLAVAINIILGFFQEYKAEKSLQALNSMIVPMVHVIRDAKEQKMETTYLVPGDMVILSPGRKVPADGVLIKSVDLQANEAMLTGESAALKKNAGNDVLMGTTIVEGRGIMEVVKTGRKTRMGAIASELSHTTEEETPLKKQLAQFSKILVIIFGSLCFLIFLEGLWRGRNLVEIFTLSIAVAVAAIPESLMISLTVILTLGMQRILKKKGLIRKLLAAETLASVDVICADKTGTLTEGKMEVVGWEAGSSQRQAKKMLIKSAILCNNMITSVETSMMRWAINNIKNKKSKIKNNEKLKIDKLIKDNPRLDEIPFSSQKKYIAVLTNKDLLVSGAPERIISFCQFSKTEKHYWYGKLDKAAKQGLRVVGFAWRPRGKNETKIKEKNIGKKLFNFGLLIFEDPVRLEVKEVFKKAKLAGISIKVITGDYLETAKSVLKKLAIEDNQIQEIKAMSGEELKKLNLQELEQKVEETTLFYRTTPEQKIRIVKALQNKGHAVAMMGDGVNDALALKKAEIGIVMGESSQVAKETADLVLLDSNFKTVIIAIEEGRGIFVNIRKMIVYLLSHSFTEIILIGGSFLMGLATPLLSAQILWINLVEHGLTGLAISFEPKDKGLMQQPPFAKNEPILDKDLKFIIFVIGCITDGLLFVFFIFLLKIGYEIAMIRTVIFACLIINSLLRAFSCKALKKNIWEINIFSNWQLLVSVALGLILLILSIYLPVLNNILGTRPLVLNLWILSIVLAVIGIIDLELAKLFLLKRR